MSKVVSERSLLQHVLVDCRLLNFLDMRNPTLAFTVLSLPACFLRELDMHFQDVLNKYSSTGLNAEVKAI